MRVEQAEVVDDDGHGQVERENAEQRADGADQHAEVRPRTQVAVADRRHRHDRPPQTSRAPSPPRRSPPLPARGDRRRPPQTDRDRREAGAAAAVRRTAAGGGGPLQSLGVVDERREDDESDDEEEHEQTELVGARAERLYEDLQSRRMMSQLEQAQYTHDADELQQFTETRSQVI